MTRRLLHCRNYSFERHVYAHAGHEHSAPAPTMEELAMQAELKQVEEHREKQMEFEGFKMTHPFNENVDARRLGVREDIAHALDHKHHGVAPAKLIINKKVNDRIRAVLQERQNKKGRWQRVKEWATEKVSWNPVSWFRGKNSVDKMLHEEFGTDRDLGVMRDYIGQRVVRNVLSTLTPPDLAAVVTALGRTGGPYTPMDVGIFLRDATYSDLRNARLARNSSGTAIFGGNRDLENLLELRRDEVEERKDTLSAVKFDPSRLREHMAALKGGTFVDKSALAAADAATVENDEKLIYALVMDQIWQKDAKEKLDTDHIAKAVLAETYTLMQEHLVSAATPMAAVEKTKKALEKIRDGLKVKKPPTADADKSDNDRMLEKLAEHHKEFMAAYTKVSSQYRKAPTIARAIKKLEHDMDPNEINKLGLDPARRGPYVTNLRNQLNQKEQEKSTLLTEVNAAEVEYKDKTGAYLKLLLQSRNQTLTPGSNPFTSGTRLHALFEGVGKDVSQEDELFSLPAPPPAAGGAPTGPSYSALQQNILGMNRDFLEELDKQIEDTYNKPLRTREKLDSRHFLVKLMEIPFEREIDESRRKKLATLAANLAIVDAETVELDRAGNAEAAEAIIGHRKLPEGVDTFTARAIFLRVGNVEGLKQIKKLKAHMSPAEVRKTVKDMSTADLMKASEFLEKALLQKKVDDHHNIEIADSDWQLAKVLKYLRFMREELRYRELLRSDEGKKLPATELAAKLLRQASHDEEVLSTGVLDKVKGELSHLLKKPSAIIAEFGPTFKRIDDEAKKGGITGASRLKLFHDAGITNDMLRILAPSVGSVILEKIVEYFRERRLRKKMKSKKK